MRTVFKISTPSTSEQQHCLHQSPQFFEVGSNLEQEEEHETGRQD